jgi:large subunit ribosomal protein L24
MVITGRARGKTGVVRQVLTREGRIVVAGVNIVKRHMKPRADRPGGIVEREAPLHVSNVMVVCKSCGKPTRVAFRLRDDGRKVRYCRRCTQALD